MSAQPALAAATPGVAWELTSNHGPTNVSRKAPANLVMTLTVRARGGKFSLYFENEETGEEGETKLLPYDASAAELQEALEKVKGEHRPIGAGNVLVTGGPGDASGSKPYTIEFTGALAGRYIGSEALTIDEQELTEAEEKKLEKEGEAAEEGSFTLAVAQPGYHGSVDYQLTPRNTGAVASAGTVTVLDQLPAGLSTKALPAGEGWICEPSSAAQEHHNKEAKLPEGAGMTSIRCTSSAAINPDADGNAITIEANTEVGALSEGQQLVNRAQLSGGGAAAVEAQPDVASVSAAQAPFGIHDFSARATGPAGETYTQAGGRPYAATTSFFFNTVPTYNAAEHSYEVLPAGNVKDVSVKLPAGFVGNPQAAERCTQAEFTSGLKGGPKPGSGSCKPQAQVGEAAIYFHEFGANPEPVAVYDLVPPAGVPAEFGFIFDNVPIRLDAHVVREGGPDGEYRVGVLSADVNEIYGIFGVTLSLWGVPGESSHDAERFKSLHTRGVADEEGERAFLSNPTDCLAEAAAAPSTTIYADSWQQPGPVSDAQGDPQLPNANWFEAQAVSPAVSGCGGLRFEPSFAFAPTLAAGESAQADAPAGYTFELAVPQSEAPKELATPELKDADVTLPEGVAVSPSGANGLAACPEAGAESIGLESTEPGHCPDASQIGTVTISSQLLAGPLEGRLYVGEPECDPCSPQDAEDGRLFKLYIEAEGQGVRVKLAGRASVNTTTGRLAASFQNNPQLPFQSLQLKLEGGPRAPLATPQYCGSLTSYATLTPWSLSGTLGPSEILGTPAASLSYTASSQVAFDGSGGACPASLPFAPGFRAGTPAGASSEAGHYSELEVVFERHDREQDLSRMTVKTPPGLLGKIAGIERCGGAQAASGACPAGSQIGVASAAAGSGPDPYVVSGPVYLTEGYGGAPFGLSIVVPAQAGPFNLGDVVVRASIAVDPTTAALTITSDPLPQSRDGVPFRLKWVSVRVNHRDSAGAPDFMVNPTSCANQSIGATIDGAPVKGGEAGASAQRGAPFTVGSCGGLTFKPTFTAGTQAKTSKAGGASLRVKVALPGGAANVRQVELQLPNALPSRLTTLQQACTESQFAANPGGCPEGSQVGSAIARTPLLNVPLQGPAYLVSHGGAAFPDLVFLLRGEGIQIELVGHTDIKKGITYSKFETVPDAPIESFEASFPEGPHSVLAANGNLCAQSLVAPTKIVAQDDAQFVQNTPVTVSGCPPASPSVTISKVKVKGDALLVTVKTSAAGTLTLAGGGLRKTVKRDLKAGSHRISVRLDRKGMAAKRRHGKLNLKASLVVGAQHAARTKAVRA
ncbi:MAG TPA: hypothetical protein VL972_00940 [Solirubrobacteraceae bacterium]|nr:hypothetical protein [Solirubrobacteraceae bacterium]